MNGNVSIWVMLNYIYIRLNFCLFKLILPALIKQVAYLEIFVDCVFKFLDFYSNILKYILMKPLSGPGVHSSCGLTLDGS